LAEATKKSPSWLVWEGLFYGLLNNIFPYLIINERVNKYLTSYYDFAKFLNSLSIFYAFGERLAGSNTASAQHGRHW
jgi:hypothetical protein